MTQKKYVAGNEQTSEVKKYLHDLSIISTTLSIASNFSLIIFLSDQIRPLLPFGIGLYPLSACRWSTLLKWKAYEKQG